MLEGGVGPPSEVVAGANVQVTKVLSMTSERGVVVRPKTGIEHLSLDKETTPKGPRSCCGSRLGAE